jgi:glutamyl/glutaminyl-tRNA synthetase
LSPILLPRHQEEEEEEKEEKEEEERKKTEKAADPCLQFKIENRRQNSSFLDFVYSF